MNWSAKQRQIKRKIDKYGVNITIRAYTRSDYSHSTDAYTLSSTDYIQKGIFLNYKKQDIDGTIIRVGDRHILTHAVGLPTIDLVDSFAIYYNSKKYISQNVKAVNPGGTTLLYDIQIRG